MIIIICITLCTYKSDSTRIIISHTETYLINYESLRNLQIHRFEDQVRRGRELDDLPGSEAELLVVVQHGVHVLDPESVHRSVENQPFPVEINGSGKGAVGHRQNAVAPFVRGGIELSVQLTHRNGFGIDDGDLHAMFVHQPSVLQETEAVGQHPIGRGLATERQSDDHEAVTHDHHLVNLLDLLEEVIRALKIRRDTGVTRARVYVRVIWRW